MKVQVLFKIKFIQHSKLCLYKKERVFKFKITRTWLNYKQVIFYISLLKKER